MKYIILFFCIVSFSTLIAQAPHAFNYQGIARDLSGAPLADKNISLRISILSDLVPATEVYKENHFVLTNRFGLFTVEVGHGSSQIGVFSDIEWGLNEHYIQIEIDENGGNNFQTLGVSQLLSVPYALYAGNTGGTTDGLWEENQNGISYTDENVGIGTDNPLNLLTLDGNFGTGDQRFLVSINNTSLSNRSFSAMKFLAGDNTTFSSFGHNSETYDVNNYVVADFGGIFSNGAGIHLTAGQPNGIIKFMTGINGNGFTDERMRISSDGNVGIGTESPVTKLQIKSGDIYLEDVDAGVIMKSPSGDCWRLTVNNDGSLNTTSINCPN